MGLPAARPREISSRSDACSAVARRHRGLGAHPPWRLMTWRMTAGQRSNSRPIWVRLLPCPQPSHSAATSSTANFFFAIQHLLELIETEGVAMTGLHHPDSNYLFLRRPLQDAL